MQRLPCRLRRQLGSNNIDHRLREQDFADDAARSHSPSFELPIADIDGCDAVLLVGCNPRQEAPILGHRLRQAWRKGASIAVINPIDWPFTFDTSLDAIVAPQAMAAELAALAGAFPARTSSGRKIALGSVKANIGHTLETAGVAGLVKAAAGIATLLLEGIGDTIRFSLTADPVEEAEAGRFREGDRVRLMSGPRETQVTRVAD